MAAAPRRQRELAGRPNGTIGTGGAPLLQRRTGANEVEAPPGSWACGLGLRRGEFR